MKTLSISKTGNQYYRPDGDIYDYVASFQRGEEKGFTFFFNKHYPALTYYAYRKLNDVETAEDVVKESFIKIWERHSTFTHPKVIMSWLYTTVRNGCLNKMQQRARMIQAENKFVDEESYEKSYMHDIIRAELIAEIHLAYNSLPTACRQIFKMLYLQGKTIKEVAEELELSISTIKNQKARALGLLRKRLSHLPAETLSGTLSIFILIMLFILLNFYFIS